MLLHVEAYLNDCSTTCRPCVACAVGYRFKKRRSFIFFKLVPSSFLLNLNLLYLNFSLFGPASSLRKKTQFHSRMNLSWKRLIISEKSRQLFDHLTHIGAFWSIDIIFGHQGSCLPCIPFIFFMNSIFPSTVATSSLPPHPLFFDCTK